MENSIKLYEFDNASYFTGVIREIASHEGYNCTNFTDVPVPNIPEGYYARYNISGRNWTITDVEKPVGIMIQVVEEKISMNDTNSGPKVI